MWKSWRIAALQFNEFSREIFHEISNLIISYRMHRTTNVSVKKSAMNLGYKMKSMKPSYLQILKVWIRKSPGFKFTPLLKKCMIVKPYGSNPWLNGFVYSWLSMTLPPFFFFLIKKQSHTNYFCDDQSLYFCNSTNFLVISFPLLKKNWKILSQKKRSSKKTYHLRMGKAKLRIETMPFEMKLF